MNKGPLFISFYTEDYKEPALKLQKQLKAFGRPNRIQKVTDTGSWKKNIRRKPTIIAEMMNEARQYESVVWLDADAILLKDPVLFDTITEEVGLYFYKRAKVGDTEPLAGTMFFRNTSRVRRFLKVLAAKVAKTPVHMKRPDQQFMRTMLPTSGLSVYELPQSYSQLWTEKTRKTDVVRHQRWSASFENPKVTKIEKFEKQLRHRELSEARQARRAEREGRAWYPLGEAKKLGKMQVRKLREKMALETRDRNAIRKRIAREKYLRRIGK